MDKSSSPFAYSHIFPFSHFPIYLFAHIPIYTFPHSQICKLIHFDHGSFCTNKDLVFFFGSQYISPRKLSESREDGLSLTEEKAGKAQPLPAFTRKLDRRVNVSAEVVQFGFFLRMMGKAEWSLSQFVNHFNT